MIAAALALSLSLSAPQSAPTHQEALTCTGVFLFAGLVMAQQAEQNPSPEADETVQVAARLMKAADDDRLAAATREGVTADQSGEALTAWIQANLETAQETMGRELDPSLARYASAI